MAAFIIYVMLTKQEEEFINYWEAARLKKKKSVWQFSVGLPLAVCIVLALFVNLVSGWYKRADMIIRSNASLLITIMLAAMGIVAFISYFSARHQWEQKEQQYQELLAKKKAASAGAAASR